MKDTRTVISFADFLGSIAGINNLLMKICVTIFGGYIGYLTKLKWIEVLYRFKLPKMPNGFTVPEKVLTTDGRVDFKHMDRGLMYLKHRSCYSKLIKAASSLIKRKQSIEETLHFNFIDLGFERLGYTLNFQNYINMMIHSKIMKKSLIKSSILQEDQILWFDDIQLKALDDQ